MIYDQWKEKYVERIPTLHDYHYISQSNQLIRKILIYPNRTRSRLNNEKKKLREKSVF